MAGNGNREAGMKLLVLAGSSEARQLCERVMDRPGLDIVASLAGLTRAPVPLGVETRIGGFGGRAAYREWLARNRIGAVIDATHPFAHRMARRAAEVSAEFGMPHLKILRPEWRPGPQDRWVMIDHEREAAAHVPPGATVFIATGRRTLEDYANLATEGRWLIVRQIEAPSGTFPFPNGEFQIAHPPFTVEDEIAFFRERGVDWLIVKNAGGTGSWPKLEAARRLGLPVAMIRRPPAPDCATVPDVDGAVAWRDSLMSEGRRGAAREAGA